MNSGFQDTVPAPAPVAMIPPTQERRTPGMARQWWVDRAREPSTYQGLSLLAGAAGQYFFGSTAIGEHALQAGLAVCGLVGMGKYEPIVGRDYHPEPIEVVVGNAM